VLDTDHARYIHLLKLVTGVDTSTRPARRSGRAGKTVKRSRRTAAAAAKSSILRCVSMAMVTLSYALIGSMAVLDTSALEFWQDACRWTLVALTPDPCPLVGRIFNFFAPAKSSTVCTDKIAI